MGKINPDGGSGMSSLEARKPEDLLREISSHSS